MRKLKGEGLFNARRSPHEMYDMARRHYLGNQKDAAKAEVKFRETLGTSFTVACRYVLTLAGP